MTFPCSRSSLLGTILANAHGRLSRNLTVRYSGSEQLPSTAKSPSTGEGLTNRAASGHEEQTIRTTVDEHHSLVRCRRTGKTQTKTSDLSEGTAWMENHELMAGIAGTGAGRQAGVRCYGSFCAEAR